MMGLLFTIMLANRVYELCGHLHYFVGNPIRTGFQKTRPGHTVFTIHDGMTFVLDATFISANFLFIGLAAGHLAISAIQIVAWSRYQLGFFDVIEAKSFYSDGRHRLIRMSSLALDLAGQFVSVYLLLNVLKSHLALVSLIIGVIAYVRFTIGFPQTHQMTQAGTRRLNR